MSSSNCCFLTCIQISQESGHVVWYSPILKNFPQFVVIHTIKGFGVVHESRQIGSVKQEMARENIDILGISELKWTGMGEFNSDDHYITTVGKNPLKKWSSHHGQQKSPKCSTWMQSQK